MPALADKVYRRASSQTPDRGVNGGPGRAYDDGVFIAAWDGAPPADRAEWIQILREVLAAELGSYRIVFRQGPRGWRFTLEWREDPQPQGEDLIANTPESVAYNLYANLAGSGKPVDPGWRPGS
jgi:hypothetical protein